MIITFSASIDLPGFQFLNQYKSDPKKFMKDWLEGAASNVCGNFPEIKGGITGTILNRPKAKIFTVSSLDK